MSHLEMSSGEGKEVITFFSLSPIHVNLSIWMNLSVRAPRGGGGGAETDIGLRKTKRVVY